MLRRRHLTVEINGVRCKVVGQLGLLHAAVDVTGVECKAGDRAVVAINPLFAKGMRIQYR